MGAANMWRWFRAKTRKATLPVEEKAGQPGGNYASIEEFARAFDALGEEQRAMLAGPGIRLSALPEEMLDRIMYEVTGASGGSLTPDPEGNVRVRVTRVPDARHFTIAATANLAMTVLAQGPIEPPDDAPLAE
jgi:hypothetical protein